jgi:undecaprenyl-diphosphatase
MDTLIIFGAKYFFVLPVVIIVIYFLFSSRKWGMAVFGIADLALTYAIGKALNHLIMDPRPFVVGHFTPLIPHAPDNGFPSDHTLLTAALAGIVFCYNRTLGILMYVLAILIGASRVLAGVHHAEDIIGSLVIAVVSTWIIYMLTRKRLALSV